MHHFCSSRRPPRFWWDLAKRGLTGCYQEPLSARYKLCVASFDQTMCAGGNAHLGSRWRWLHVSREGFHQFMSSRVWGPMFKALQLCSASYLEMASCCSLASLHICNGGERAGAAGRALTRSAVSTTGERLWRDDCEQQQLANGALT